MHNIRLFKDGNCNLNFTFSPLSHFTVILCHFRYNQDALYPHVPFLEHMQAGGG